MTGTGELAGATFDATGHLVLLGILPSALGTQGREQIRLKAHGTGTHALAATDTGVGFCTTGFLLVHDEQTATALGHRNLQREKGFTHHRTTADNLAGILWQTAAFVYQLLERCAQTGEQVAWLLHALACNQHPHGWG